MPSNESGRQTLLFSATMPKVLIEFTKSGIMDADPNVVRLDKDATVSQELRIGFVCVRSQDRDATMIHLLRDVLPKARCTASNHELGDDDDDGEKIILSKKKRDEGKKSGMKGGIIKSNGKKKSELGLTLIFAATRHHVDYLTILINNSGIGGSQGNIATCIYGKIIKWFKA